MVQFSSLEKLGIVFLVFLVVYLLKFVFSVLYTYALGPALNKVNFKTKGKWACKFFSSLFLCLISLYVYYLLLPDCM